DNRLIDRLGLVRFGFHERRCGGHHVALIGLDQTHALRRAPDGANVGGTNADQLAVGSHDENIRIFLHAHDPDDLAVLGRGLDVDDSLAAPALSPVFVDASALAITEFGYCQHHIVLTR